MLAGVILLMTAGPVAAQRVTETETGSHISIPQRARIPEGDAANAATRGRLVMAQFARCVVDREYRGVAQALALPMDDFNRAAQSLATSECLIGGEIRFPPRAIRGPLFKELYVRRAAASAKGGTWGPKLAKADLAVAGAPTEAQAHYLALMDFAQCVIASDAEDARQIVLRPTASTQQDQAIKAIAPNLGPCISQGSTLHMGKEVIEGSLAEALYRGVEPLPEEPAKTAESK